MKFLFVVLVVALLTVLSLLVVPAGNAADNPTSKLDQIASEVAGKPVTVFCETNDVEWDTRIMEVSKGRLRGYQVDGYAFPNATQAFIAPRACRPLLSALRVRVNFATSYSFSVGLITLIHEATHLRGLLNESEADCEAVQRAPAYIDDFGIPAKINVRRVVRGLVFCTKIVNPLLARLRLDFRAVHDDRPPVYQGAC